MLPGDSGATISRDRAVLDVLRRRIAETRAHIPALRRVNMWASTEAHVLIERADRLLQQSVRIGPAQERLPHPGTVEPTRPFMNL
jgi:hypothetical protein